MKRFFQRSIGSDALTHPIYRCLAFLPFSAQLLRTAKTLKNTLHEEGCLSLSMINKPAS